MDALSILSEHQLLTASRIGQAACSKEGCEWGMKFTRLGFGGYGIIPTHVSTSHAAHQLQLLAEIGYSQEGNTKADVALRRIRDEVGLLTHGGITSGDCGPIWHEPLYPVPRRVRVIEAILTDVLGD
jgi:hypothetical protein